MITPEAIAWHIERTIAEMGPIGAEAMESRNRATTKLRTAIDRFMGQPSFDHLGIATNFDYRSGLSVICVSAKDDIGQAIIDAMHEQMGIEEYMTKMKGASGTPREGPSAAV